MIVPSKSLMLLWFVKRRPVIYRDSGMDSRKSRNAPLNSAGRSRLGMCAAPSIMTSVEFFMRSCMNCASLTWVKSSSLPTPTSVGAAMSGSIST